MLNLRYELAQLGTDYYLSGFLERYRKNQTLPPPQYILWDCTRRCNLKCLHCGAVTETYPSELSTEQITALVDQLAELRVGMFAVTGGEPLLRADMLDVLAYARQRGLKTGLATNGFLLDAALAQRLKQIDLTSVQISLDGLEATHNQIRGNPRSFARAVSALEHVLQLRLPVITVATTVTPHNLAELEDLRQLVLRLKVKQWRLVVILPIGRAQTGKLALNREQLITLLEFVRRQNGRGLSILISETLPFLGAWEKRVRRAPLICPVGFLAACIGVNGEVRGCPEMPDIPANREGSALEKPLAEIWQTGFKRYRERKILTADPLCAACTDQTACSGGCWVMRVNQTHCIRTLLDQAVTQPE